MNVASLNAWLRLPKGGCRLAEPQIPETDLFEYFQPLGDSGTLEKKLTASRTVICRTS
jgi:hypothetical protein